VTSNVKPDRGGPPGTASDPAAGHEIIALHAGWEVDGQLADGFLARPIDGTRRPGLVLLSNMRGLSPAQRELTRRYGRAGFVALTVDVLHGERPQTRLEGRRAMNTLDVEAAVGQIVAGADFLRSLAWVGPDGRIGILGFCLGGGLALLALGRSDRFQAGVIYHQSLFPDARALESIAAPLLCHYGTLDRSTPREEVEAFTAVLDRLGKRYELHWYEGLGHGFAEPPPDADVPPTQRAAAELSHARSIDFLWQELGVETASAPGSNQPPSKGQRPHSAA
jgi:carboxymethylenebutenolidase